MNPSSVTRREFLYFVLASLGGIGVLQFMAMIMNSLSPRFRGSFLCFWAINLPTEDLPQSGDAKRMTNFQSNDDGRINAVNQFWLVNTTEGVVAYGDRCPHDHSHLRWNAMTQAFYCPVCGSQFSTQGSVLLGPSDLGLNNLPITVLNVEWEEIETSAQCKSLAVPSTATTVRIEMSQGIQC